VLSSTVSIKFLFGMPARVIASRLVESSSHMLQLANVFTTYGGTLQDPPSIPRYCTYMRSFALIHCILYGLSFHNGSLRGSFFGT
jgi:hypothetical protein